MSIEIGTTTVEFVWEGEFCYRDCEWLNHDLTYCVLHSEQLKLGKLAVDPVAEYTTNGKAEPYEAPIRCKSCRNCAEPMGLYRRTAKTMRVYPSPEQILNGEWVPAEKLIDFKKVLPGWFLRVEPIWQEEEEDNVKMISVKYSARKGKKGKIRELGTAFGLIGLDKLPKGTRLPFMLWANTLYEEAVDITDSIVFDQFYAQTGEDDD